MSCLRSSPSLTMSLVGVWVSAVGSMLYISSHCGFCRGRGKIVKSEDDRENGLELKDTKIMNNADCGGII